MTAAQQTDLAWLLQCYGWLMPRASRMSAQEFAQLVVERCDQTNRQNKRASTIAAELRGVFSSEGWRVSYAQSSAESETA